MRMGSPSKGGFVLIAVGAALFIAVVANVVARFWVNASLDWFPSVLTAAVVGAFVALLVFRRSPPAQQTAFVIEARHVEEVEEPRRR